MPNHLLRIVLTLTLLLMCGCSIYGGVRRPGMSVSLLTETLSDELVEQALDARPEAPFPSVLAVAKIGSTATWRDAKRRVEIVGGADDDAWKKLTGLQDAAGKTLIDDVRFISPMLVKSDINLRSLRQAAAMLRAPLLLVYVTDENASEGYNDAAMLYWTIVGLYTVPGNTVGHYCVGDALLIDTRSGLILSTAHGEGLREENVFYGAVPIAEGRTAREARSEAMETLVLDTRRALLDAAADSSNADARIGASSGP